MRYNFVRINPNEGGVVAVETPDGRLPIRSFRDFYAFEQHVKAARARRGVDMIPDWYKIAVFYFSNSHSLLLDGEDLQFPSAGEWLDFELEVGAVIGKECRNVKAEDAEQYILGYTVINDWSLRDAQKAEMVMNLGPAKGKDFATTLGPVLVTPDELEAKRSGKGFDLHIYDREVALSRLHGSNRNYIDQAIPHISSLMQPSIEAIMQRSETVVVAKKLSTQESATLFKLLRPDQSLIDLVRLNGRTLQEGESPYYGICW